MVGTCWIWLHTLLTFKKDWQIQASQQKKPHNSLNGIKL
jgi:hypothetical protein